MLLLISLSNAPQPQHSSPHPHPGQHTLSQKIAKHVVDKAFNKAGKKLRERKAKKFLQEYAKKHGKPTAPTTSKKK